MKNKMKGTKLINCIHDEIWLETNIENMEIEMNTLVSSMCSGFEKYIKLVPCKIDSEVIEGS